MSCSRSMGTQSAEAGKALPLLGIHPRRIHGLKPSRVDAAIAERAAALRARYTLRTPDALQIATALHAGCQGFLTNDTALRRVTDLRVLVLHELEL